MVAHVFDQMKDNLIVFLGMRARSNAMLRLLGMYSNIRQATSHKAVETFLKFFVFLFPDDTARWRCTFLAMMNNLKLTNIKGGRNKTIAII